MLWQDIIKLFCFHNKMCNLHKSCILSREAQKTCFHFNQIEFMTHQDPIRCGNHNIMALLSGNPISQKSGILHWQGCKTCLPKLKWLLQTRKDLSYIRNFWSESCFGSLVKICDLICWTYKKLWWTYKNLWQTNFFHKLQLCQTILTSVAGPMPDILQIHW